VADERWHIGIDSSLCAGTAVCVGMAPKLFKLEGGYGEVISEEIEPDEEALTAADSCPMSAIMVRDSSGKTLSPE
jgi:ferredoxin